MFQVYEYNMLVNTKIEIKEKQTKDKQKFKEKLFHKKEKIQELENISDEKKENIMKKLSDLEIRREQMMERRNQMIKDMKDHDE